MANEVGKGVADDSADEWSHWTICTPISIYSTVYILYATRRSSFFIDSFLIIVDITIELAKILTLLTIS